MHFSAHECAERRTDAGERSGIYSRVARGFGGAAPINMNVVLTIAGSDSSGGAGIQADLKTFTAHKLYGESVVTALTAQNTTGVHGIFEVTPDFVRQQIDAVFKDIPPDAVKIGMVSNVDIINSIAEGLAHYNAKNIVVDPVMVATSGDSLMSESAKDLLANKLFPLAAVVTPNIAEAEVLCGFSIYTHSDMIEAAKYISKMYSCNVLVKGGHLEADASDLLFENGSAEWFYGDRIDNENTHGTGCTLSSAIACNLALGANLYDAVKSAKAYVTGALKSQLKLGAGSGPIDHVWEL